MVNCFEQKGLGDRGIEINNIKIDKTGLLICVGIMYIYIYIYIYIYLYVIQFHTGYYIYVLFTTGAADVLYQHMQTRAEGESLYIRYNTDANVVNGFKNRYA